MASNVRIARREYWPTTIYGVAFGGKPYCLLRTPEKALVWVPGYTSYINRFTGNAYAESSLWVVPMDEKNRRSFYPGGEVTRAERQRGGRLALWLRDPAVIDRINREFGDGAAKLITQKYTVIIGDGEPFLHSHYLAPKGEWPPTMFLKGYKHNDVVPVQFIDDSA